MQATAKAWAAGAGGGALATVTQQFGAALQAGGVRQYSQMRYSCVQLAAAVRAAQSAPPIPVAAMESMYAAGLDSLTRGAADCEAAISLKPDGDETVETHENSALLSRADSEIATGASDLFKATAQVEVAARQ
jgi:hypothetical protein